MVARNKRDLHGAEMLVAFTRLEPSSGSAVLRQIDDWYQFEDSVIAISAARPLIGPLRAKMSALTRGRVLRARAQAEKILADLMALSRTSRQGPPPLENSAALSVVKRRLQYRFVLPPWMVAESSAVRPGDLPGWGSWQLEVHALEDLLAWATAQVLSTNTGSNIGECAQCGRYYVAKRRKGHRFCPGSECRDKYWQARTGTERVKRSRLKAAAGESWPATTSVAGRGPDASTTSGQTDGGRDGKPH